MDPLRHHNHHRRRPSSDRFLTTFSPPSSSSTPLTTTTTAAAIDDFSEDDILFTATTATTNHLPPPSSAFPKPPPLRPQRSFKLEPSGILAALPDPTSSPPSRTISIIPQINSPATSDHHRSNHRQAPFSMPAKYHQSAPMHVPTMPAFRGGRQRRRQGSAFGFESIDDAEADVAGGDDDEDEMLPPHEMVARRLAETPVLSSSVLEGAGRTLKGRDLRQVRNAVFRHTGFID
ncbi:hypothetical protein RND81_04G148100 [Saponaria officinalis]|uniref:Senescence regulator n=1 Tax=Saponaria officinalis TaxID=3572 RepID=A0AAW1LL05_SAPOF